MGIFQAIGKGFTETPKLFKIILILFAFSVIAGLIMIPFTGVDDLGNSKAGGMTVFLSILAILIFIFFQGGSLAASRDIIKSNKVALNEFVGNGAKYYVNILVLGVLTGLIAFIGILLMAAIGGGLIAISNAAFMKAFVVAIIVLASLTMATFLLFPVYAVVGDNLGPIQALKKGIVTAARNFWKVFLLTITVFFITLVIAFIIGILGGSLASFIPEGIGSVVTLLINSAINSYLSVIVMVTLMVYYLALGTSPKVEEGPGTPTV